MFIYGLNLAVIGLLYFFIYHSRTQKTHFLRLSLGYLFLISSLRNREMGADYPTYVQMFYSILIRGTSYVEKGYVVLNKIVGLFTVHYVGLAIAVNTLLFVPLYFYIKKQVKPKYWPLCVFIFAANPYMFVQSTFNLLRQCCATGILMLGVIQLLKNKDKLSLVPFCIMVLLAAQFHRSAYIMIIIPIVLSIRWKKAYWIVLTLVSVVINLVGARYIASFFAMRLGYGHYLSYSSSLLNNPIYIGFIAMVIFFFLSHYDAYIAMGKREKGLIDLYLFSLVFLIMAVSNDMFYRVYLILAFCSLPGVPIICESTRIGFSRIRIRHEEFFVRRLYVLYYFVFYVGYMGLLAINQNSAYVPFRFFS